MTLAIGSTMSPPRPSTAIPLPGRRSWVPIDGPAPPGDHVTDACIQGSLALTYPLPAGVPASPRTTALVVVPHGQPSSGDDLEHWAATFVQAVIEVIASDRPVSQLIRWTSRRVYAEIVLRQRRVARHRGTTVVRSSRQQVATVRVCRPAPGCAEVAARVVTGSRSRAVAVRLDRQADRWLCTAIHFG